MPFEATVQLVPALLDAAARPAASLLDVSFRDGYVGSVIAVSLYVSLTAVALSTLVSVPAAVAIGLTEFPGKGFVKSVVNTGMGFPSVVVGLVVLFAVSNQGPLGSLELIFTREAMIMSQFVLATPPITAITLAAITGVDDSVRVWEIPSALVMFPPTMSTEPTSLIARPKPARTAVAMP